MVSTAVVMTEGEEGSMDKKLVAYIVPDSWEKVKGTIHRARIAVLLNTM